MSEAQNVPRPHIGPDIELIRLSLSPTRWPLPREQERLDVCAALARIEEQLEALHEALTIIAETRYPAQYVGRRADGVKMYGGSDDASRFAREVLASHLASDDKQRRVSP